MFTIRNIFLLGFILHVSYQEVSNCNRAECASVVSKCMLLKKCRCDLTEPSCVSQCAKCLSDQYLQCCSCIEACPKDSKVNGGGDDKPSFAKYFLRNNPELFEVLTGKGALYDDWESVTFTTDVDFNSKIVLPNHTHENLSFTLDKDNPRINCTVMYVNSCLSHKQCKKDCRSFGACGYRWFENGCCECFGHTCINYGWNKSQCKNCPANEADKVDDDDEDNDYVDY